MQEEIYLKSFASCDHAVCHSKWNIKSYIYKVQLILHILSLAAVILSSFIRVLIQLKISEVTFLYCMPYIKAHLLHEPWYITHRVENFTVVKPHIYMFKFLIGI